MRASPEQLAGAVQALLKQVELSPEDTERRLSEALDIERWRRLVPFASIGVDRSWPDDARVGASDSSRERRRLEEDGYFSLTQVFERDRIARMHRIVETVRADGWPVAFVFVFDDFWSLARSPAVMSFLEASLGAGFLQNSIVWAHWVGVEKGLSGWSPHDDCRGGGKTFLSLWIPLSDATTDNGCMFLLPDEASREIAAATEAGQKLSVDFCRRALHSVIALPVPAGSLIGWRGDVLHWGGMNAGGLEPRVSLALEFRARGASVTQYEQPLIDPRGPLPPFRLRLWAIAKALGEYPKFEPLLARYLPLARRLFAETSDVSAAVSNAPPAP